MTQPFFRAEHIGGLLRPQPSSDARCKLEGNHRSRARQPPFSRTRVATEDDQKRKPELVAEVARDVWGQALGV
jgi:hypothetical protein